MCIIAPAPRYSIVHRMMPLLTDDWSGFLFSDRHFAHFREFWCFGIALLRIFKNSYGLRAEDPMLRRYCSVIGQTIRTRQEVKAFVIFCFEYTYAVNIRGNLK